MKFNGSYEFEFQKQKVWEKLNNTEVLKNCIDGCQEFVNLDKNQYKAKVFVKLGPVNTSFQSIIKIENIIEEESYEIEAKGSAGQLGNASGKIKVSLEEKNNMTILNYQAETRINGKLAQLGSRLIDGSVKKNTDLFFNNFSKNLDDKNQISSKTEKKIGSSNILKKVFVYLGLFFFLILIISLYVR